MNAPVPPRTPQIELWVTEMPEPAAGVVRLSWFRKGRVCRVREFCVYEAANAVEALQGALQGALDHALDASVITHYEPAELGLDDGDEDEDAEEWFVV